MRSSSKVRHIARTTAAAALLVAVVTIAPISGAGASDATSTTSTTSTTAGAPVGEERVLQCESGVLTASDGTQTSSATLERVPSDTEPGPGCRFVE